VYSGWYHVEQVNKSRPCLVAGPSVKIVLIDFHTHTTASDGALQPGEIVARALDSGVGLLAITDHDTVAGYRAAAEHYTPKEQGMRLIHGIELSCQWSGTTIHILGLGVDCEHPALAAGLVTMNVARRKRGERIGEKLAVRGFPGALEGALLHAGESQLGRPHFAAWMIEQQHVSDFNEAFDRHLGQGKPGDVKAFWPELAEVTAWIEQSGGAAVIAHPLKYRFTGMKLRRLIIDFVAAGGSGIEVLSGRQTQDQTAHLKRLAQEYQLEISVGSDFHRDSPYSAPLGVELSPFEGLPGVWERWAVQTDSPPSE